MTLALSSQPDHRAAFSCYLWLQLLIYCHSDSFTWVLIAPLYRPSHSLPTVSTAEQLCCPHSKIRDNSLKYKVIFHTISLCRAHISKMYVRTAKSLNRAEQIKYIFDYDHSRREGLERSGTELRNPSQKASQAEKQLLDNTWHVNVLFSFPFPFLAVAVCIWLLTCFYSRIGIGICKIWVGLMLSSVSSSGHMCPNICIS